MAEIHVGANSSVGRLISEAAEKLQTDQEVRLTGLNYSASRVIDVAEALKHKVKNLHQKNEIESLSEEGRNKTRFTIVLSLKPLGKGLGV
ncbi:MAG: hypothetical protein V2I33_25535 [Kangiellaceae bacterium]|jgi:hypothetical protein|nr:hypothetical protein [Kangiellaceae bacterium]